MFSAIFTFLGGAAFRYALGRVIDWLEKRQEHQIELEQMRAQENIDQAKHTRQLDMIRLQSELKLTEVKLVGETQLDLEAGRAFTEAMKHANRPTGNVKIDAWNGSIRPAAATMALGLWFLKMLRAGFELTQWDMDLVSSILGFYFADRHMGKPRAR